MTNWQPVWQVQIDGVSYTSAILANLSITSGRRNIYEQASAGFNNLELLDVNQAIIPVAINSTVSVSIENTTAVLVPIFGGNVVDIGLSVRDVGSTMFTQSYNITSLGALARLPKVLTDGVLAQDFDGDQIYTILSEVLMLQWNELPTPASYANLPANQTWSNATGDYSALAVGFRWMDYDPSVTWATAENTGLGDIDRPGNYDLAARTSDRVDVYSLVSALATSGLGYIYEDAQGRIGYADSTHRSSYLAANGYTDLDANHAKAAGLSIITRAGDVRNSLTIKFGATSSSEASALDSPSISTFGTLAQIITTTLANSSDATDQAAFYLALRAQPFAIFNEITFDLTNPELDDADRDALLGVFMGQPIALSNLPLNMNAGTFQGFVEGWSFRASYNQLSITLFVTPLAYSLQAMRWDDVPVTETWLSVIPTLDWQHATLVA